MAHQGYLRRIAKVEQCLSGLVTCGMLSNCVRMVSGLLIYLGRPCTGTRPLLETTGGLFKTPSAIFIMISAVLVTGWLILPDMLVSC